MVGTIGEIRDFARVGIMVIELSTLTPFVPLGVTPARCAKAVSEESRTIGTHVRGNRSPGRASTAHDLRNCPPAAHCARVFQQRNQALTLDVRGRFHAT